MPFSSVIKRFFLLPLIGLASAMLALTGQNYGAQQGVRVMAVFRTLNLWGATGMFVVGFVVALVAYPLARLFNDDPEVVRLSVWYLWISVPMMPVWSVLFLEQSFTQALKRPYPATAINVLRQIPLPLLLIPLGLSLFRPGPITVWVWFSITNTIAAILLMAYALWLGRKLTGVGVKSVGVNGKAV